MYTNVIKQRHHKQPTITWLRKGEIDTSLTIVLETAHRFVLLMYVDLRKRRINKTVCVFALG